MVNKGEMTKELLGAGLKALMLKKPFEKITIKMITDEAGVIRPTFYNHFKDKYELLEWIFSVEIGDRVREILQDGLEKECIKLLFVLLEREKEFYRKAFLVTGQNSFEDMMESCFYRIFSDYLKNHSLIEEEAISFLDGDTLAAYYFVALTNVIKLWMNRGDEGLSAEQMTQACYYLMKHSLTDLIRLEE